MLSSTLLSFSEVKIFEILFWFFLKKNSFQSAFKIHTGEKPNKCDQCEYAFSNQGALRSHLKTHSEEKSNKCHQCGYAFSHADSLRGHLRIHSGEKSKKCEQCDYAICILSKKRFESAFENTHQWRKVYKMQPM